MAAMIHMKRRRIDETGPCPAPKLGCHAIQAERNEVTRHPRIRSYVPRTFGEDTHAGPELAVSLSELC